MEPILFSCVDKEKIDIATAFLMMPDVIVIDRNQQGNETSRIVKHDDIDELEIPEKGTYIRGSKEENGHLSDLDGIQ